MKWHRIAAWAAAGVLGSSVIFAAGAYCWLYSWSWGAMPEAHPGYSPAEQQCLQALDSYLVHKGSEDFRAAAWRNIGMSQRVAGSSENELSWWTHQVLKYGIDYALRNQFAGTRRELHDLVKTGAADNAGIYLAVAALHTHDAELVRLIVSRGLDVNKEQLIGGASVSLVQEVLLGANLTHSAYMPVEVRLGLLEWLLERGMDVNGISEERLSPSLEMTIMVSGDETGQIMEWMLRHGLQMPPHDAMGVLLRYPTTLATLQRLIQDGVLPPMPDELQTEQKAYTPLQMVAANTIPSPDSVRWLISLGHSVNALPVTGSKSEDEDFPGEGDVMTPLDVCLHSMRYMGFDSADTATLEGKLQVLDILLQHGARPGDKTMDLLPVNPEWKQRVVELMQRHGYHLMVGKDPFNACCRPEQETPLPCGQR